MTDAAPPAALVSPRELPDVRPPPENFADRPLSREAGTGVGTVTAGAGAEGGDGDDDPIKTGNLKNVRDAARQEVGDVEAAAAVGAPSSGAVEAVETTVEVDPRTPAEVEAEEAARATWRAAHSGSQGAAGASL